MILSKFMILYKAFQKALYFWMNLVYHNDGAISCCIRNSIIFFLILCARI